MHHPPLPPGTHSSFLQNPLLTTWISAIYNAAEKLGHVTLKPRSSSPVGLFGQYDGNVIGGFLLGAGMALSGSCPGTVLAQAGVGLQSGFYALGGALLGGIVWTGIVSKAVKAHKENTSVQPETVTLNEKLGVSKAAINLFFETVCLSAIAASVVYTTGSDFTLFSAGSGLFLGFAQFFSLLTRRSMLGVSGSYEEVGNHFWWLVGGVSKPSSRQNMMFATGVAAGAWAIANNFPSLVAGTVVETDPVLAVAGGFVMVVGSRLAGGCTSGHGISGLSLLSTSSLVTIVSAFGAGLLIAPLVH